MSTWEYVRKITRPEQCVIAAIATWVVALLSNGPSWFAPAKFAAAAAIFFSVLGASLWHYGARSDMYAKKHYDLVLVKNPILMRNLGAASFGFSILITTLFLPWICIAIATLNMFIIFLYAKRLDQFWPWKNLVIAFVCTTPLLVGWMSGHRLHPVVFPMIVAAFFIYLTREILKDIQDREANHGLRYTMALDIGVPSSLRVAGIQLFIAFMTMLFAYQFVPNASLLANAAFWIGALLLLWYSVKLLRGSNIAAKYQRIDLAVASLLFCMLTIRLFAWK